MTDKVQKIKDWISKEQDGLMDAQGNFEYPEHEGAYHILCNLDAYIDSLQEEPVSEDFEKIIEEIAEPTILNAYGTKELARRLRNTICGTSVSEGLEKAAKADAMVERSDDTEVGYDLNRYGGFIAGAQWQKENLWRDAQGDDLPDIDREVIVLTQPYPLGENEYTVSFAHRPNPNGWDGKSITTGNIEHYTPKTYDKGGWNIPNVKYWLDVELPKEIEL